MGQALDPRFHAFRLARDDWSAALSQLPEAIAMSEEVFGNRYHLLHSPLLKALPIHEIRTYLETLPVDTTSGWRPHLVPRGTWFFSE